MQCPYCRSDETRVLESRKDHAGTVQRRRTCVPCGERFATVERINVEYLNVRKHDGRIERFQREKIAKGIGKAASTFRIPAADVNAFIDRILDELRPDRPGVPIPTRAIGELVLRYLQDSTSVTDVARIRFAMVFLGKRNRGQGFKDASDLRKWLEDNYPTLMELDPVRRPTIVLKRRTQAAEPFDIRKLERSIGIATKGRDSDSRIRGVAEDIARAVVQWLDGQSLVTTQQIATVVMNHLREFDDIAYLRYAATTKPFRTVEDFWHEILALGPTHETCGILESDESSSRTMVMSTRRTASKRQR
jgi:transcriptional repressor NrdR